MIGERTHHGALDWHCGLQWLRRIPLRGLIHHLHPNRQRQSGTVTTRNNRDRLIESDPHAAGDRAGITYEPRIFVIVSRAGLARRRQFEA